jgi:RHS repeat-associated protein
VYTYNVGNQRTALTRTGENTASYGYDPISEVVSDTASEVSGGAARLNEQLHYVFDPAGNLNYRTNNALVENFQVNALNELTANTNGGTLTVMGTTTSQATNVTVNSTAAAHYGDTTFAAAGLPLTTTYTATASDSYGRQATNTVTASITTNNASFQYDGNGNLTNDGLRNFAFDDENQLIQVWITNQWLSQFAYDGKMRRRSRQEYTWQSSGWVQTNEVYYVYDGNTVIQERSINNLPTTTYTRGLDLSGSFEGAGGIGGLLSMTLNTALGSASSNSYYYHSDGNGNVTMLINPSQYIVAKYLYDAFGNILSASGSFAQQNLYRFSSKEAHLNSGLVYYLCRYYDPNLQRWLSRDPILENAFEVNFHPMKGFVDNAEDGNEYLFVHNNALSAYDAFGLCTMVTSGPGTVIGGIGTVIIHHPIIIHTHYPPVTDTFSLQCPTSKPYLVLWGLGSSTYSPWYDNFPSGWGLYSLSGGPPAYIITISVPSSIIIWDREYQLGGLFVQGCCSCASIGTPQRVDPPAPPPFPPDPYNGNN